jgi:hypothetical protein
VYHILRYDWLLFGGTRLMAMLFGFSVQECAQLEARLRVLAGDKELLFAVQ